MNASLLAMLDGAVQRLQSITRETVTLAGIDYACTAATVINGSLEFFQGGAADMRNASVCVLQSDLPIAPSVNTVALFRGDNFRVKSIADSGTLWQLMLIQEFG
jgi:hypothetical protein